MLEIVILRSLVALPLTVLFFQMEGNRGLPSTVQKRLEYTRGFLLFLSYNTYFMGVAALPLAVVAPFEYITLPINAMWGYIIWSEVPTQSTWIGAALTLSSGLYILYRESKLKSKAKAKVKAL